MSEKNHKHKKAIVLLSGGMDSATVLALATQQKYSVYTLCFDYGQRHVAELNAANNLAQKFMAQQHKTLQLDMGQFGGSALTDHSIDLPTQTEASSSISPSSSSTSSETASTTACTNIPISYVPARNTVFLSYALAWAEVLGANDIFIGVNAVDYSGYPDCRPEYIQAYEEMANLATKAGVEGQRFRIHTPLIKMSKADIIKTGIKMGVDYAQTVTCYQADALGRGCAICDACILRKQGFLEAKVEDNTRYQSA